MNAWRNRSNTLDNSFKRTSTLALLLSDCALVTYTGITRSSDEKYDFKCILFFISTTIDNLIYYNVLYDGHSWPQKGEQVNYWQDVCTMVIFGHRKESYWSGWLLATCWQFGKLLGIRSYHVYPHERLCYNIMFYYIPKLDLNAKQTATVVSSFHTLYMYAAMQKTNGNKCHKSVYQIPTHVRFYIYQVIWLGSVFVAFVIKASCHSHTDAIHVKYSLQPVLSLFGYFVSSYNQIRDWKVNLSWDCFKKRCLI